MKKWIILLFAAAILSDPIGSEAASPSAPSIHRQYLQTLDSIQATTLPVVDSLPEMRINGQNIAFNNGQGSQILALARQLLGTPVVWGGSSPREGFDCSGLVQYVFRQAGIALPRTADLQFLEGRTVSPLALQPGDLVYYTTYEPGASHVGIYIGNDQFIHTSYSQGVVAVASMKDSYFVKRYYGAKRVL